MALQPAAWQFLRGCDVALVATRSAKGHPFMTPLWCVPHAGALYVTTGRGSWAARNVAATHEAVLLFGGERGARQPTRRLTVRAEGDCVPGTAPWPVLLRTATRYFLRPRLLRLEWRHRRQWGLRRAYYGQAEGGPAYLRLVPVSAELTEFG